ncbi:MAG: DNA sulfur modification protein DndD [Krumholzibacteria bacterium]|nr:DNA sulfur modification protein DndD [Candidatus Krumholzibacteria bacterium]
MRLTRVTFHDYRVYAGKQHIDLAPPAADKPVVLIGGLNGEGKTTLLEGIQLALYGRRSEVWQQNGTNYTEYLAQSIHRSGDPRGGAMVEVEFEAIDQDALRQFKVQRSWKVNGGGKVIEYVQVFLDGQLDKLLSEDWNDQVERFIPARLAGLFFFDGEKIKHYADPQRSQELIERGVLSLLGIDLLDQLDVDLKGLEARIAKGVRKGGTDAAGTQLEEKRDALRAEERALQEQVDQLGKERERQVFVCEECDREYVNRGGTLFEQRIKLESDRKRIHDRRTDLERGLIEVASGCLPLRLAENLLAQCAQQMLIEYSVSSARAALNEMSKQQKRLGNLFRKKKVAKATQDLMREFFEGEAAELKEVAAMPGYLNSSDMDYVAAKELLETRLDAERGKAADILKDLRQVDADLQSLDRKLAAVPDDEAVAASMKRRESARHKLAVLEGKMAQVEETRRVVEVHLGEAEKALHKHLVRALEGAQDQADNARVLDHAERVRDTLVELRERLVRRRLAALEQTIKESYANLMRKNGMIAEISIDPQSYQLSLRNREGSEIAPDWLSAGERQLLVVAILWGLARASGRGLPVIVDTPLGRLDSSHRDNLVRHYFPHASHQVILLSTDEEIIGRTLKLLSPAIGHRYRLVYDDVRDATTIETGYFKERAHAN